jgi:hypothetical protein
VEGKTGRDCFNAKPVTISHAFVFRGEEKPLNASQRTVSTLCALNMKQDFRRLSCSLQLNCLVESKDTAKLTIIDNVYETDPEPSKVISLLNKSNCKGTDFTDFEAT